MKGFIDGSAPGVGVGGGVTLGVGDPPGVTPGVEGSEGGGVEFGNVVGGATVLCPLPHLFQEAARLTVCFDLA